MTAPTTNERPEPILASWKISEVLQRYPALLDELVALDPAFAPLRNPLRRKIQSRLVTVAQAAQIAGLEPAALVRDLNRAAGVSAPASAGDATPARTAAGAADLPEVPVAVELDVRPLIAQGDEPFGEIMRAARQTPIGQMLRLRAPFEPVPLYDVLGKQGFTASARQLGPDDWEVAFLRTGEETSSPPAATTPAPAVDWDAPSATVTIDVSELVPPEPLVKILEALEELPPGGALRVHHVRRPIHLYPRLDELGCGYETREPEPGRVEILIQKPAEATA
jgi:uncharacterized protein (DUF2249 family)